MNNTAHIAYSFDQIEPFRYRFISTGRQKIKKAVEFIPLKNRNMVNLGFGDVMPDGTINDRIHSNNGDIRKVLATVVQILLHFTSQNPSTMVFFAGNSVDRTKLYSRILKMHYFSFK